MGTNHPWSSEFAGSIKTLYAAFASYKAQPTSIGICGNCVNEQELEALFAKPLRLLDANTIHVFASVAVGTHGSITDWKHFLPRFFELLPDELYNNDMTEIYLSTLRHSHWLSWPNKELLAVRTFLIEWWRWTISYYPSNLKIGDAISAIAQAEDDLLPYLDEWDLQCQNTSPALRHLVDFYHTKLMIHGRQDRLWLGPWWDDRTVQESQMCHWLMQDYIRKHFERARHEYATTWNMKNEIDLILIHQSTWREPGGKQ